MIMGKWTKYARIIDVNNIEFAPSEMNGIIGFDNNADLCLKYGYRRLITTPKNGDVAVYSIQGDNIIQSWEDSIEIKKSELLSKIDEYDKSDNVNSFSIAGMPIWLNKEDRATLKNGVESAKAIGRTTFAMWAGTISIELPIDILLEMLAQLEVYACDCYNITAKHKTEVAKLTTIEAVANYDYKVNYPEKLVYNV